MQLLVITWAKLFTRARVFSDSKPAAPVLLFAQEDRPGVATFDCFACPLHGLNNCQVTGIILVCERYAYSILSKIISAFSYWVRSGIFLQIKNRVNGYKRRAQLRR